MTVKTALSIICIGIFLVLFSVGSVAQSSFCSAVSFTDESFSLVPSVEKEIDFRIKNNAHEDFFIDLVSVEKNNLFSATGKIVDNKIFAFDSGRVGATVTGGVFEEQKTAQESIFVTGHFENGERCFLEHEFYFMVKPVEKAPEVLPELMVEKEIDATGAGFIYLNVKNPNSKIASIKAEPSVALLNRTFIEVKPFTNERLAVSVNFAKDGEIVYFNLFSGAKLVSQKYAKLDFPKEEEPVPPIIPPFMEEKNVQISSYSATVSLIDGMADAWVVLDNKSDSEKTVFVGLKNLPEGVQSQTVQVTLAPHQKRQIVLPVNGNTVLPVFNAILSVEGDSLLNRQIVFENKTPLTQVQVPVDTQDGIGGIAATAFALLSENVLGIIFALVIILLILLIFWNAGDSPQAKQAWVSKTQVVVVRRQ